MKQKHFGALMFVVANLVLPTAKTLAAGKTD